MSDYKKHVHNKKKKVFTPLNLFLIAINVALLISVLFFSPNKYLVISVYFLETFIIGIFNVIRMFTISLYQSRNNKGSLVAGVFMILFFVIHFGIFYFVQLALILGSGSSIDTTFPVKGGFIPNPFLFFKYTLGTEGRYIVLGIILFQLVAYIYMFLGRGEYRDKTMQHQMMEPYGRIFVQQFVVIIGGFFIIFTQNGLAFSILLILFKTILDLFPLNFKTATKSS